MPKSPSNTPEPSAPDRIPGQPDMNAGAPRPSGHADNPEGKPDMDHPPRAVPGDTPVFDQGTAAEEEEARDGTLPDAGPRHTAGQQRAASAADTPHRPGTPANKPGR